MSSINLKHTPAFAGYGSDMGSIFDIEVTTIEGESTNMANYRGSTLLIVNVASKCGFTPQYEGLEQLYQKFKKRGFVVLGFPCNQFGNQEPGSESEIAKFCRLNYGVSFPLFAKIEVNGKNTHPLYAHLKKEASSDKAANDIRWNFTKFLVNEHGQVVQRFSPSTSPEDLDEVLEKQLVPE